MSAKQTRSNVIVDVSDVATVVLALAQKAAAPLPVRHHRVDEP